MSTVSPTIHRFAVRGSRFAVRGSRFAVRGSRFAVRGSRFAELTDRAVKEPFQTGWLSVQIARSELQIEPLDSQMMASGVQTSRVPARTPRLLSQMIGSSSPATRLFAQIAASAAQTIPSGEESRNHRCTPQARNAERGRPPVRIHSISSPMRKPGKQEPLKPEDGLTSAATTNNRQQPSTTVNNRKQSPTTAAYGAGTIHTGRFA